MIWPLRPGNSLKGRVIHGLLVFPSGMASLNFWSLTCDMAGNLYANSWTKTYLTGASFFFPRGQAFILWPVEWGMLRSWCCGELNFTVKKCCCWSKFEIQETFIPAKSQWTMIFFGHGGYPTSTHTPMWRGLWKLILCRTFPKQEDLTGALATLRDVAATVNIALSLTMTNLACPFVPYCWPTVPISSCRPWDLPTEMRRKLRNSLIFTSCKHGKAQVWVMTDIHSLIVIYGRSLLR